MIAQVKPLIPKDQKKRIALLEFVRDLLERTEAGEIVGLVLVLETQTGFEYIRRNMSIESAVAVHVHAVHKLNQESDKPE